MTTKYYLKEKCNFHITPMKINTLLDINDCPICRGNLWIRGADVTELIKRLNENDYTIIGIIKRYCLDLIKVVEE